VSSQANLQLTLVGTNHKYAPVDVRERLWCRPEALPDRLRSTVSQTGNIAEATILSTCNRTEIYAVAPSTADVSTDVTRGMSEWSGIQPTDIQQYTYVLTGEEAVEHRALRKLGDLPSREKTILDLLTRRIVNKRLYEPTVRLKEHAANGDGESFDALIRDLFDIRRHNEQ